MIGFGIFIGKAQVINQDFLTIPFTTTIGPTKEEIKKLESVKVGMTRKDLMVYYQVIGGIRSGKTEEFFCKKNPYIKIMVEFSYLDEPKPKPDDKITKISRPYLDSSESPID